MPYNVSFKQRTNPKLSLFSTKKYHFGFVLLAFKKN